MRGSVANDVNDVLFVVCRTNMAYGRFWEALTQLEDFDSKLTDVLIHTLALDRSVKAKYDLQKCAGTEEKLKALRRGHKRFKNVLAHLLSLLQAVAFSTLRDDYDLYNMTVRTSIPNRNLFSFCDCLGDAHVCAIEHI